MKDKRGNPITMDMFLRKSPEVANKAIAAVYKGSLVRCTAKEYHDTVRDALQNQAAKWIDQDLGGRAQIALSEVKRLDHKFNIA